MHSHQWVHTLRRCAALLLLLLLSVVPVRSGLSEVRRLYHPVTIDHFAASRQTHVIVTGRVAFVRGEADGDTHIRLIDMHGHFIVVEIIQAIPLQVPQRGQLIRVSGIRRFDDAPGHGWPEIHPAEKIEVLQ